MIIWFHISWNNAIVCALQGEKSRSRIRRKWGEKANAKHTKYHLFDFAHEMSAIIFVYENTIYKIISNHFFFELKSKAKAIPWPISISSLFRVACFSSSCSFSAAAIPLPFSSKCSHVSSTYTPNVSILSVPALYRGTLCEWLWNSLYQYSSQLNFK